MSELVLQVRKDSDAGWTRLLPGTKTFEVPENEGIRLDIIGPNAHLLKREHVDCVGELHQLDAGRPTFSWRPFEHIGKVAYGWLEFRIQQPQTSLPPQLFFIRIVPSRLNVEQWTHLFEDVRRVADALVTNWLSQQNPHVGGLMLRSPKFSPATAMAEMEPEWDDFVASLGRIARAPRTEFRPPPPHVPRADMDGIPEPIRDANVYENALVALTVERLAGTLRRIRHRAEATMQSAEQMRERYENLVVSVTDEEGKKVKRPHSAMLEAQHLHDSSRMMADTAQERALLLQRNRRKLPGRAQASGIRGRIPHITSRIRHHPDYSRVIRWYRAFGHQQLAFSSQELLSVLGTRRASTLYEYWCILALFSALVELGYTPQFQELSELVREDIFELELWSNHPITFTREEGAESLTVWYERQAHFHPKHRKEKQWRENVSACAPETPTGLYSRLGPREPDFWFELRRGDQLAVAVGDAIFSEGVDTSSHAAAQDIVTKMTRVKEYVEILTLVDSGRARFPVRQGLIVFCGHFEDLELIEEQNAFGHVLLPLRPVSASPEDNARPSIPLDPRCLQVLAEFLQNLRDGLTAREK
jgi:hypothetical protein